MTIDAAGAWTYTLAFTSSANAGEAPLTVSFDASSSSDSDGTIASYAWKFGDGAVATGKTIAHTYNSAGRYTVTLTVTDNQGAQDTASATITATEKSSGLAQVQNLKAETKTKNQVTLSWSAVSGATEYEYEISDTTQTSVFLAGSGTSHTIKDLSEDLSFDFRVRAKNGLETGAFSNKVTIVPDGRDNDSLTTFSTD